MWNKTEEGKAGVEKHIPRKDLKRLCIPAAWRDFGNSKFTRHWVFIQVSVKKLQQVGHWQAELRQIQYTLISNDSDSIANLPSSLNLFHQRQFVCSRHFALIYFTLPNLARRLDKEIRGDLSGQRCNNQAKRAQRRFAVLRFSQLALLKIRYLTQFVVLIRFLEIISWLMFCFPKARDFYQGTNLTQDYLPLSSVVQKIGTIVNL